MATASGARTGIQYVIESTMGTTPTTPQMIEFRATTRDINLNKNILESNEVRENRQQRDVRHGFNFVGGSLGFELGMWSFDDWLEALLGSTYSSNVLKVGTSLRSFSVERRFPDIAQYQVLRGVVPNTAQISIQPDSLVTVNMGIVGMSNAALSGTQLDATPTAARTNPPFSSFSGAITEGGSSIAVVTGLELNITNNRTVQGVVGSNFSPEVFDGEFELTGTLNAFFQNATLLNKFINETESSLAVTLNELGSSENMIFTVPRLKYTGGTINPPASGPVQLVMPFRALYDTTAATMLTITRSNAPS